MSITKRGDALDSGGARADEGVVVWDGPWGCPGLDALEKVSAFGGVVFEEFCGKFVEAGLVESIWRLDMSIYISQMSQEDRLTSRLKFSVRVRYAISRCGII